MKVPPLNPKDNGQMVNISNADPTFPSGENIMVGTSKWEGNTLRKIGFKVLDKYTNSVVAPPVVMTPIGKITEQIYQLWDIFEDEMPYPVFPFEGCDKKAADVFINIFKHIPCSDYVKLAIKNKNENGEIVIDLSYMAAFETQDGIPLGGKIYLKNVKYDIQKHGSIEVIDWEVDKIITERYGLDNELTEKSYATLCRSFALELTWTQHLLLCHLYGSSHLASDILASLEPNSRYRRLFCSFFPR